MFSNFHSKLPHYVRFCSLKIKWDLDLSVSIGRGVRGVQTSWVHHGQNFAHNVKLSLLPHTRVSCLTSSSWGWGIFWLRGGSTGPTYRCSVPGKPEFEFLTDWWIFKVHHRCTTPWNEQHPAIDPLGIQKQLLFPLTFSSPIQSNSIQKE